MTSLFIVQHLKFTRTTYNVFFQPYMLINFMPLYANPKKCVFFLNKYWVSGVCHWRDGCFCWSFQIQAIDWLQPKTLRALRGFLGLNLIIAILWKITVKLCGLWLNSLTMMLLVGTKKPYFICWCFIVRTIVLTAQRSFKFLLDQLPMSCWWWALEVEPLEVRRVCSSSQLGQAGTEVLIRWNC